MATRRRDRRWHALRRAERNVCFRDGIAIVSLGSASVWDTGDLVRLREVAAGLLSRRWLSIGIDLSHVAHLPSGFMNMLCEWCESGFEVHLFDPPPVIQNMLWFRQFTESVSETAFRMNYASSARRTRREGPSGFDRPVGRRRTATPVGMP